MACRLINLHDHPLRVDLRAGTTLLLAPGVQTRALREELLYDNEHVAEWERAGWLRRVPARMSEVLADDAAAQAPLPQSAAPAARKAGAGKPRPAPARRKPSRR